MEDTITVVSLADVTFCSTAGKMFTIAPKDCGKAVVAPSWILDTYLYHVMEKEGLITCVSGASEPAANENPVEAEPVEVSETVLEEEKPAKTTRKKG